jgi:YegS/Rv2252/BmrU family lipid kinase
MLVRICVIFNPVARGNKARKFRRNLDLIAADCALKQTAAAGGARPLAAEAIAEGFDTIVAAGGDGTLNEVLNGIGDVPGGFDRVRLGVLPLGTVNVFAKELGIPANLRNAWKIFTAGKERRIDLPRVEFRSGNTTRQHYFIQLAGSGLDARAIELTDWELKKKVGPLAYVVAGFKAMARPASRITVTNGSHTATGELVLIGNGKFYGGKFAIHPRAQLDDGRLHVRVFHRTNLMTLVRCAGLLIGAWEPSKGVADGFDTHEFTLTAETDTPLEVDGENIGYLPARFTIKKEGLRVIVP